MTVESEKDLEGLLKIGRICGLTLKYLTEQVRVGMTTKELDELGGKFLEQHGARSAPILAYNYPGYTCISINDVAAHGIPDHRVIRPGDMVNIDVSAELDGYWADCGGTVPMPPVNADKQRLCDFSKRALAAAIEVAKAGTPLNAIGRAVETEAKRGGYSLIRELGGHGVGRFIHEPPSVPNVYLRSKEARQPLTEGMVMTIEPFLTTGAIHVETDPDGWTLRMKGGGFVAQYEHTVVITKDRPILVTAV